jgi:hypothetical protein
LLILLADALEHGRDARPELFRHRRSWLWETSKGPLWGAAAASTAELPAKLEAGEHDLVFVYEHDAIAFLLSTPGDYVMLNTLPSISAEQICVGISERGNRLGVLLEKDPGLGEILQRTLHVRTARRSGEIETSLRSGLLARATLRSEHFPAPTSYWASRPAAIPHAADLRKLVEAFPR